MNGRRVGFMNSMCPQSWIWTATGKSGFWASFSCQQSKFVRSFWAAFRLTFNFSSTSVPVSGTGYTRTKQNQPVGRGLFHLQLGNLLLMERSLTLLFQAAYLQSIPPFSRSHGKYPSSSRTVNKILCTHQYLQQEPYIFQPTFSKLSPTCTSLPCTMYCFIYMYHSNRLASPKAWHWYSWGDSTGSASPRR